MRKEDLYQAIGELDEKILAKSEAGWKPSRVFRTALTAAACLLLAAGIGSAAFFGFGRDPQGEAVTPGESFVVGVEDHSNCEHYESGGMLLAGDALYGATYYECAEYQEFVNAELWYYDPAVGTSQILGDIPAALYSAQSGNYCVDRNTQEVYRLDGAALTKVGELPAQNEWTATYNRFLELEGDTLYFNTVAPEGFTFSAMNVKDGSVRELYHSENSGSLAWDGYFRYGMIYYPMLKVQGVDFYTLDVESGENRRLDVVFPDGEPFAVEGFFHCEDALFLSAKQDDGSSFGQNNLYKLDYDTLEVTRLDQADAEESYYGVHREGNSLLWYDICYEIETDTSYSKLSRYDLTTGNVTETNIPVNSNGLKVYSGGCYYDDNREEYPGIYHYDLATGEAVRIDPQKDEPTPEPSSPKEPQPEEATAEPSEESFFALFHELDESSMRTYLDAHPEVLNNGWGGIDIDASGLTDTGTDIRTKNGDQVLAVNAKDGVLLIRVEVENARGVLAIGKDTTQLRLCPAETLGTVGQTVGTICENNGGVLAMTGSAFIDSNGEGNGGELSGLMVSGGETYGTALGGDYKRLELREDDRMYIVDSDSAVADDTRDAVEFQPAAIVDGKIIVGDEWNGFNPRALIGQSERLETMMLVMEGRFLDSVGCGVEDCSDILKAYGCAQAMNLDGGTSAMMYYRGKCVTRCSNTDLPDGRTLPSAWVYGEAE